jgi:hypothetical protein
MVNTRHSARRYLRSTSKSSPHTVLKSDKKRKSKALISVKPVTPVKPVKPVEPVAAIDSLVRRSEHVEEIHAENDDEERSVSINSIIPPPYISYYDEERSVSINSIIPLYISYYECYDDEELSVSIDSMDDNV